MTSTRVQSTIISRNPCAIARGASSRFSTLHPLLCIDAYNNSLLCLKDIPPYNIPRRITQDFFFSFIKLFKRKPTKDSPPPHWWGSVECGIQGSLGSWKKISSKFSRIFEFNKPDGIALKGGIGKRKSIIGKRQPGISLFTILINMEPARKLNASKYIRPPSNCNQSKGSTSGQSNENS